MFYVTMNVIYDIVKKLIETSNQCHFLLKATHY